MKTQIIVKSVYIPIIGLFIGLILFFTNSKYYDLILREKYTVIYMMIAHILSTVIVYFYLLINHNLI